MGFGLKELKLLWNIILEISDANNISREEAVNKFFKDVKEDYDDKLGFESEIHKLKEEASNLSQQNLKSHAYLNVVMPSFATAIAKSCIIYGNNGVEELNLLLDKVQMVGGIKAAIDKLSSQPTLLLLYFPPY